MYKLNTAVVSQIFFHAIHLNKNKYLGYLFPFRSLPCTFCKQILSKQKKTKYS